jgi:hypothetical protein
MNYTRKFYGTIEISSGRIVCSDPCYKSGEWCADSFPAKNGLYRVYIYHAENRNAILEIIHQDYDEKYVDWENADSACAVDSGTFGFFDKKYYDKHHEGELDEEWYENNVVLADDYLLTDGAGAWSSSGYGDGMYHLDCIWCDKENDDADSVAGLRVLFIDDGNYWMNVEDETWMDYKEDGDTSYNEFDELESDVDSIESDVELLIDKCQEYNVSEDKFDNLSVALDYLQRFRKEMEIGRDNCRNAYAK